MKLSRSEEVVLTALFNAPLPVTNAELATMLGYHPGHVRKARKALEKAGLVEASGTTVLASRWKLTEDGLGEAIARQVGGDTRMVGADA